LTPPGFANIREELSFRKNARQGDRMIQVLHTDSREVESKAMPAMIRLYPKAETGQHRLMLLAPQNASVPPIFRKFRPDVDWHEQLLAGMQRLRGDVYLQDGAIGPHELSADGRHRLGIDRDSWHLLLIDRYGAICGCVRYCAHTGATSFDQLWVGRSALASSPVWGGRFRSAVESGLRQARSRGVAYVEVGGWALDLQRRGTTAALRIALATYSLAALLGGCIGITTATARHGSSSILHRLGGSTLESAGKALPPYYDPQFQCEMEILGFDSERPAPKFLSLVNRLRAEILEAPVIWAGVPHLPWQHPVVTGKLPLPTPAFQEMALAAHA
jgi:hypothetical protein